MKNNKSILGKILILACAAPLALTLSACGGAKETLGLTRQAPDEFTVVKRAPLELPPDYTLRPPEPGAVRPQEQGGAVEASAVVFGAENTPKTSASVGDGEAALLQRAGATRDNSAIRQVVDAETSRLQPKAKTTVQKLFKLSGDAEEAPASVVDAKAEKQRILDNKAQGKSVTDGSTPAIEE